MCIRDLTVGNTACSPVENELYTDVKEEHKNEEEACILQENENPLYEAAGDDTVLNPIYDRFVCVCLLVV